jgi:hypothetical protein
VKQTRGQRSQRQQIEAVVFEYSDQRPSVAGANKVKVSRRDLEAGHIAGTSMSKNLLLQRYQRTAVAALPELPRRMQHVNMRQSPPNPILPVKKVPRFEQGGVERLAIEADERAGAADRTRNRVKQRTLVREPCQQELTCDERLFGKPPEPYEKSVRAGASTQSGCLEVEEHEGRPDGCTAGEPRCLVRRAIESFRNLPNLFAPMPR